MTMEPNLPKPSAFKTSKLKETFEDNLRFLKSLLYLTKKIFML